MKLSDILLIAGGTFGLCWLVDRGFTKAFRSAPQHKSGKAVRLNKHFGGAGVALVVLGILGLMTNQGWLLAAASGIILTVGGAFLCYYMSFGLYYDDEGFLLSRFGRQSATYRFQDIRGQQLYVSGGKTLVELYLADGSTVQLTAVMTGTDAFLDAAFSGWCSQKGLKKEECTWYNPGNSCWFPKMEDQ